MLVGEEFHDADEAHKLLYGVHFALCSAGWQRCDIRPPPVKVEAAVVEKLERGIELLSRFEEQAGGAAVDDQAGGKPEAAAGDQAGGKEVAPKQYLTSWRGILFALGKGNNREDRESVRNFNTQYEGPIRIPKQGAQPKVDKAKLIKWWNDLEIQWEVGYNRERDAKPTTSDQHDYGKVGIVVPGISGGVKRRRKDRKP